MLHKNQAISGPLSPRYILSNRKAATRTIQKLGEEREGRSRLLDAFRVH